LEAEWQLLSCQDRAWSEANTRDHSIDDDIPLAEVDTLMAPTPAALPGAVTGPL
jgi:hypothetical protein